MLCFSSLYVTCNHDREVTVYKGRSFISPYFHLLTLCPAGKNAKVVAPAFWTKTKTSVKWNACTSMGALQSTHLVTLPSSWNISQTWGGPWLHTAPTDWGACSAAWWPGTSPRDFPRSASSATFHAKQGGRIKNLNRNAAPLRSKDL